MRVKLKWINGEDGSIYAATPFGTARVYEHEEGMHVGELNGDTMGGAELTRSAKAEEVIEDVSDMLNNITKEYSFELDEFKSRYGYMVYNRGGYQLVVCLEYHENGFMYKFGISNNGKSVCGGFRNADRGDTLRSILHNLPMMEIQNNRPKIAIGSRVRKKSGSEWEGVVVGSYSTELTPVGWCVESSTHKGSVQIYPEKALELVDTGR